MSHRITCTSWSLRSVLNCKVYCWSTPSVILFQCKPRQHAGKTFHVDAERRLPQAEISRYFSRHQRTCFCVVANDKNVVPLSPHALLPSSHSRFLSAELRGPRGSYEDEKKCAESICSFGTPVLFFSQYGLGRPSGIGLRNMHRI